MAREARNQPDGHDPVDLEERHGGAIAARFINASVWTYQALMGELRGLAFPAASRQRARSVAAQIRDHPLSVPRTAR